MDFACTHYLLVCHQSILLVLLSFLSVYPSNHPFVQLSACSPAHLFISLSTCLSVWLSVYPFVCLFVCLSVCLPACLSVKYICFFTIISLMLSKHVSVCLSVYMSNNIYFKHTSKIKCEQGNYVNVSNWNYILKTNT